MISTSHTWLSNTLLWFLPRTRARFRYSLPHMFLPSMPVPHVSRRSVTRIGDGAFLNCKKLLEINLCEGVLSIGRQAFQGCTAISTIRVPHSVTEIGGFILRLDASASIWALCLCLLARLERCRHPLHVTFNHLRFDAGKAGSVEKRACDCGITK
jgi:hypothetical protein